MGVSIKIQLQKEKKWSKICVAEEVDSAVFLSHPTYFPEALDTVVHAGCKTQACIHTRSGNRQLKKYRAFATC